LASEEDPLWSKPCVAYNLHAELDNGCRQDLVNALDRLRLPGSWTLPCPPASLHISVARVLSVREDYGTSKDLIWARWATQWCDSLAGLAAALQPFVVRFARLEVSTAALIAVAEPVPEVDKVRRRASQLLSRAGLEPRQPSIVHCTLARFGASGRDLTALARSARSARLSTETRVEHLVLSKELVYPNLVNEGLARLPLGTTIL
jgi:hypothetical protein